MILYFNFIIRQELDCCNLPGPTLTMDGVWSQLSSGGLIFLNLSRSASLITKFSTGKGTISHLSSKAKKKNGKEHL